MPSHRLAGTERRGRVRHAGGVLLPLLVVALVIVLAIGSAPQAQPLLAAAFGSVRIAVGDFAPQPPRGLGLSAMRPGDDADDLDGPALARAAEAGLRRLRTQLAGTFQAALPDRGLDDRLAAVSSALGLDELSRDVRDTLTRPGASAAARDAAPPPPAADAPPRVLTLPPGRASALQPRGPHEGSVTLIGHATVLVRGNGFTVLTDPNFLRRGEPARLAPGIALARRTDPASELDALPPIDLVVLSRLRDDHFDRIVQRQMPRDVPIVAPAQARGRLVAMGFESVHALPEWGSLQIGKGPAWLRVTATPTRSGPPVLGAILPASMGSLLEFGWGEMPPGYRLWISGDTRVDTAWLDGLAARLGDLDLALLHVGGARLLGVIDSSMDIAGAIRTARQLGPRAVVPLTLDDFGRSASAAPLRRASLAAAATGPRTRVRMLERGDSHPFEAPEALAAAPEEQAPSMP